MPEPVPLGTNRPDEPGTNRPDQPGTDHPDDPGLNHPNHPNYPKHLNHPNHPYHPGPNRLPRRPMPEHAVDSDPVRLSDEDAKLVTLARAARARIGAAEGAAVRDQDGRTYAGASVHLASPSLTALQYAVAAAVSAGAGTLEAAVVVTEASTLDGAGYLAVRDLAAAAPVHVAAPDGTLLGTVDD